MQQVFIFFTASLLSSKTVTGKSARLGEETKNEEPQQYETAPDLTALVNQVHVELRQAQLEYGTNQVTDTTNMVMVSYSWNEKEPARNIYAALKASGINAWIDYYNMTYANNLPQAMGETVEDSTVIVICYSQAYQNSQNCRQEALYSFQLKKKQVFAKVQENFKATGWLEFIVADHQYYNFYDESLFESNFENLLGNVEGGLNGSDVKSPKQDKPKQATNQMVPEIQKTKVSPKKPPPKNLEQILSQSRNRRVLGHDGLFTGNTQKEKNTAETNQDISAKGQPTEAQNIDNRNVVCQIDVVPTPEAVSKDTGSATPQQESQEVISLSSSVERVEIQLEPVTPENVRASSQQKDNVLKTPTQVCEQKDSPTSAAQQQRAISSRYVID
ncbi:uncharacterized protein LOC134848661 [Symsagittifera roscoffensis]|uniref:uncharacterized protein LOC134848661 n=1 Tax=Symsagittifera roscoffensis TaxID=84072 RepID=UPI00307CA5AE